MGNFSEKTDIEKQAFFTTIFNELQNRFIDKTHRLSEHFWKHSKNKTFRQISIIPRDRTFKSNAIHYELLIRGNSISFEIHNEHKGHKRQEFKELISKLESEFQSRYITLTGVEILNAEKVDIDDEEIIDKLYNIMEETYDDLHKDIETYYTNIYLENNNNEKRIWLIAPGDRAKYWEEYYNDGVIGFGWNYLDDLTQYKDKKSIKEALERIDNDGKSKDIDALACFQFANEIQIGDILVAKNKTSELLGWGQVTSDDYHTETSKTYKNFRDVQWYNKGVWQYKTGIRKTLTDITDKEYVSEILELLNIDFINQLKEHFMNKEIELLKSNKNIIFTGSPGTGKTYLAKQIALKLIFDKDSEDLLSEKEKDQYKVQYKFVQFHPSYDYTDFVEGLRPMHKEESSEIGFQLKNGIFMSFCKDAMKAWEKDISKDDGEKRKFVFVIDEINRGEISKIFGELFFSIDPDYRGEKGKVITQYANLRKKSKKAFYVPENVYIIGTMNDIDRSVESFDFAMRRRFTWIEITAEESAKNMELTDESMNRMLGLNAEIDKIDGLNSAYHIGAAYFLKLNEYNNNYKKLWDYHLEPLLKEYMRGMPDIDEKIKVLNAAYIQTETND